MASFNSNGGVGDVPYGPTTPPSAKVPGGIVPKQFTPTTPTDRGKNPNRVASVIGKVGDYLGNVGRSVRDLPTAVGTAIETISPQTHSVCCSKNSTIATRAGCPNAFAMFASEF